MTELEDIEVHLATCPDCAADLARYREVKAAMASLRDEVVEPPAYLVDQVIARMARPDLRARGEIRRLAHDRRAQVAAVSLGGALLGAGVIGLLWRRNSRRAVRVA